MKIDDVIREAFPKPESAAKGRASVSSVGADKSGVSADAKALSVESGFPDLLQVFSSVVAKRQQLTEQLPGDIKKFLSNALRSDQEGTSSGQNRPMGIQQGAASLLREGRNAMNMLRQMASEMEYVDRIPEFDKAFATNFSGGGSSSAQYSIAKLQQAVDTYLANRDAVQIETTTPNATPTPANVLASLVGKAVTSGIIGSELNRWISVADVVIGKSADSQNVLSALTTQLDPQLVLLSENTNRPELLRVWSAVQGLAAQADGTATNSSASTSVLQHMSQGNIDVLNSLLQNLAAGAASETASQPLLNTAQASDVSRVTQFEMLISSLSQQGGDMAKLLSELPSVLADLEKLLPARTNNKAVATVYDTLARSAPKWLRNLAQQSGSKDLLTFWVDAKVADMSPWLNLSQADRQQSAAILKELSTTYDQPDIFRSAIDDETAKGLTFQMALYAPDQEKTYPALIQIFEEKRERGPGQIPEQEVWVRVSLETDNIGPVDLSFRLQDKTNLSIFTRFSKPEIASAFKECLPEIRAEFADTPLQLQKIAVTERTGAKGA